MKKVIKIYAVATSTNQKTGNMAQTYTSENTCPARCPFKNSGCYAKNYGACFVWARADKYGMDPKDLKAWVEENTNAGDLIRHNVAGDIATPGTSNINGRLLNTLIDAYQGRRAFTYTHCAHTAENFKKIKKAIAAGFVINQSCETLAQVDKTMKAGIPAVIAVTAETMTKKTPAGYSIVQCPAQTHDNVSCKTCKLCANAGRKCAISFMVHGSGAKKAAAAINNEILKQ